MKKDASMNEHIYGVMYNSMSPNLGRDVAHIHAERLVGFLTRRTNNRDNIVNELKELNKAIKSALESIEPKTQHYSNGTPEQQKKIEELVANGYIWNKEDSVAAAGVVLDKGKDRWFFGLSGEIIHNPDQIAV